MKTKISDQVVPKAIYKYKKFPKMCNKICPDKIFANSRIAKLKIRAKYEIT
jgi:hypothetical protein